MTTVIFIVVSYLVIGTLLVIGAVVGAPPWSIGVGVFVLLFPFAIWLMLRSGRSMQKSLQESEGTPTKD